MLIFRVYQSFDKISVTLVSFVLVSFLFFLQVQIG